MNQQTSVAPWEDVFWDELLAYIDEKRVIPIVGADLLSVDVEGKPILLDQFIAKQLAKRFAIPTANMPLEPTLHEVVSEFLRKGRRERVYVTIREILQHANFSPPQPLLQLAKIIPLNLFVSTTPDLLMERALDHVRFAGAAVTQTIAYAPNDTKDLECPKEELCTPVVYHLLGKVSAAPTFVASEEDLLEFVHTLQGSRRPKLLFDELRKNHLLILGGNFSDWLTRFFLRLAKGRRLSDQRDVLEVLAAGQPRCEPSLTLFLQNFSSRTQIFEGGAIAFINELSRRWESHIPVAAPLPPPARHMPAGAVFISYASEDRAIVRRVYETLRKLGLDIWYDRENLKPGDAWATKIEQNIEKCACFLPILSQTTSTRLEGVFREEWEHAFKRARRFADNFNFIIPILIDDSIIPERFKTLHCERLHGDDIPDTLVDLVKNLVHQYRRSQFHEGKPDLV
jgi:hypothetical protein